METQEASEKTSLNNQIYWDPTTGEVSNEEASLLKNNTLLNNKYTKYRNNPGLIKRNNLILSLLGLLIVMVGELYFYNYPFINSFDKTKAIIYTIFAGFIPLSIYAYKTKEIFKDIINYQLANKLNWLYKPEKDANKWDRLRTILPEIFEVGTQDQYIDNQFWGTVGNDIKFWLGQFHYVTGFGKSSETHLNTTYAFKLSKKVPANFILSPQTTLKKTLASISDKTITTEYNDFNNEFHIDYIGDRGLKGADILQTLSPDVMEKLYDYESRNKNFKMSFSGDIVVVYLEDCFDNFFNYRYIDFIKKPEIDEKDMSELQSLIVTSIEIAEEIVPKLNQ